MKEMTFRAKRGLNWGSVIWELEFDSDDKEKTKVLRGIQKVPARPVPLTGVYAEVEIDSLFANALNDAALVCDRGILGDFYSK